LAGEFEVAESASGSFFEPVLGVDIARAAHAGFSFAALDLTTTTVRIASPTAHQIQKEWAELEVEPALSRMDRTHFPRLSFSVAIVSVDPGFRMSNNGRIFPKSCE
jgi:hypothetical protein